MSSFGRAHLEFIWNPHGIAALYHAQGGKWKPGGRLHHLPANFYGKDCMNIHYTWEHAPLEPASLDGNATRMPVPRSFLDAGGELAAALSGSMHRCLGDMELGQILEVISRDPDSRRDVTAWCLITGHELLQVAERGDETLFWIRKR